MSFVRCELNNPVIKYPNGSTIYLSGLDFVHQEENIRKLNIQTILSFTREPIPVYDNIRQYAFEIDDSPETNIYRLFEPTYMIIMSAIQQNQNILIHCRAGVSRSVSILTAFFLKCLRCNPELIIPYIPRNEKSWTDSILSFIRSKRECINPNPGFKKQLEQFEQVILPRLNCAPKPQLN